MPLARQINKIIDECLPALCQHAFGVELHAVNRVRRMGERHDLAGFGLCGADQFALFCGLDD